MSIVPDLFGKPTKKVLHKKEPIISINNIIYKNSGGNNQC